MLAQTGLKERAANVSDETAPIPRVNPAGAGFSVLEAIVVLLIASVILTLVLPVMMQSISQNLKTSQQSMAVIKAQIEERSFRLLLNSTVTERQSSIGRPARTSLEGTRSALKIVVLAAEDIGCGRMERETAVVLSIVQNSATEGARLVCTSDGDSRVLAAWKQGAAALSYSSDGMAWVDDWPRQEDAGAWDRSLISPDGAVSKAPLVSAPLVRFEVKGKGDDHLVWIERAGAIEPVELDPGAVFAGEPITADGFR